MVNCKPYESWFIIRLHTTLARYVCSGAAMSPMPASGHRHQNISRPSELRSCAQRGSQRRTFYSCIWSANSMRNMLAYLFFAFAAALAEIVLASLLAAESAVYLQPPPSQSPAYGSRRSVTSNNPWPRTMEQLTWAQKRSITAADSSCMRLKQNRYKSRNLEFVWIVLSYREGLFFLVVDVAGMDTYMCSDVTK
jgi:hypothetical protein